MRVLLTFGSKRGGTEGIALTIAEALGEAGLEPVVLAPARAERDQFYDAAIVGGALSPTAGRCSSIGS
jgi:menaquinone-dependent protoporphyrinogen oxidase